MQTNSHAQSDTHLVMFTVVTAENCGPENEDLAFCKNYPLLELFEFHVS